MVTAIVLVSKPSASDKTTVTVVPPAKGPKDGSILSNVCPTKSLNVNHTVQTAESVFVEMFHIRLIVFEK